MDTNRQTGRQADKQTSRQANYLFRFRINTNIEEIMLYSGAEQYSGHVIQTETRDNDTALPLVEVLVTLYGLYRLYVIILSIKSIKNAK